MPVRQELTWRQLRVGLMVGIALIVVIVAIFYISGPVGVLSGRYQLRAFFPETAGLHAGSQVQLSGVPVGTVSAIGLSTSTDPKRAVVVSMKIAQRFQKDIRADSLASIETAGLLGESFVDITRGGADQSVIPEGGEVKTVPPTDIKKVVQNANDVLSNLTALSEKLNQITNQITAGRGTIGKFIYDPVLYNRFDNTVAKLQQIMTGIQQGRGTIGQLIANKDLYDKLNSTVDRANQMMDQIQHGNGTMAKFINDPTLYNNLDKTIQQANNLMTGINQGKGTLGKLAKDPQLYDRLNQTAANVDVITGRMAKGQGSLGMLSTNSKLYNNLTQASESLRAFLSEFRKNPKKYLTLHLHIF